MHQPDVVEQQLVVRDDDHMVDLRALADEAMGFAVQARSENTRRAYRSDFEHFDGWCRKQRLEALPAEAVTVVLYITDLANRLDLRPATIQRRLTAIAQTHQNAGVESPTRSAAVREVWSGIRRSKSTAQMRKSPLKTEDLRAILGAMSHGPLAARDRALLLLGFAGAFRRSELVSLDVEDLEVRAEGLVTSLRRSKTDQEGQGTSKPIPHGRDARTCPVQAVQAWLEVAQLTSGPLFRSINRHGQVQASRLSDKAVALVVKRRARAAGFDDDRFSGHSLRAGFATQAAMVGASDRLIMAQTGHKSVGMVHRYIREGRLFADSAAGMIGL
jgi:site-specific recombinase XerD